MGPGQNFWPGSGWVSHLWFGFGFRKFPLKTSNFSIIFPSDQKKSLRVGSKSARVRGGWASYLLQVKSKCGSGQGPSLLATTGNKNSLLLYVNTLFVTLCHYFCLWRLVIEAKIGINGRKQGKVGVHRVTLKLLVNSYFSDSKIWCWSSDTCSKKVSRCKKGPRGSLRRQRRKFLQVNTIKYFVYSNHDIKIPILFLQFLLLKFSDSSF